MYWLNSKIIIIESYWFDWRIKIRLYKIIKVFILEISIINKISWRIGIKSCSSNSWYWLEKE